VEGSKSGMTNSTNAENGGMDEIISEVLLLGSPQYTIRVSDFKKRKVKIIKIRDAFARHTIGLNVFQSYAYQEGYIKLNTIVYI